MNKDIKYLVVATREVTTTEEVEYLVDASSIALAKLKVMHGDHTEILSIHKTGSENEFIDKRNWKITKLKRPKRQPINDRG